MTMRVMVAIGCTLLFGALACGPKRIPPGTPPPEYEPPVVRPWPPSGAYAEPAGSESSGEPGVEPDAGSVDAAAPPASDAAATEQAL
jgi:hypothetical protein